MPVFLAEQTAWRYLVSEKFDAGWHVRETRDGELVSILMTLCKGVKNVLLDPGPGVLIDRQSFLDDCLEGAVPGRVGA